MDENAMRLLMLQSVTEQLWSLVVASGRSRDDAMAAIERISDAGRAALENSGGGPIELTHQIARMQDEFWASVRQRVAAMSEAGAE